MPTPAALRRLGLCVFWSIGFASALARADVLPPQAAGAAERFSKNPSAFDRTDQYCAGKSPDSACAIPGNPFEGGGAGKCMREINRREGSIDLLCERQPWPRLNREIPAGPFQATPYLCGMQGGDNPAADYFKMGKFICVQPPLVADRFCKGKTAGSACSAELSVGETTAVHPGRCNEVQEQEQVYIYGNQTVTRPVLQCEPLKSAPPLELTPVSGWRKLFQ